jgi:hypothetical protein
MIFSLFTLYFFCFMRIRKAALYFFFFLRWYTMNSSLEFRALVIKDGFACLIYLYTALNT